MAALGPRYWPQVLSRAPSHAAHHRQQPHQAAQPAGVGPAVEACAAAPPATPGPSGRVGDAGEEGAAPSCSALDHLYHQQLIFVRKKAGSLAYADDPSGIRSLLSRMSVVHAGGDGVRAAGGHCGDDDGCGSKGEGEEEGGASGGGGGSNGMVHLCATFSADPFVMGFAQLLQQLGALQQRVAHGPAMGPGLPAAWAGEPGQLGRASQRSQCGALLHFCTSALYECVTGKAPHASAQCMWLRVRARAYVPLHASGQQPISCPMWPPLPRDIKHRREGRALGRTPEAALPGARLHQEHCYGGGRAGPPGAAQLLHVFLLVRHRCLSFSLPSTSMLTCACCSARCRLQAQGGCPAPAW